MSGLSHDPELCSVVGCTMPKTPVVRAAVKRTAAKKTTAKNKGASK